MIDLILNTIIGLLQFFSKTLLPLFLLLYGWVKWGQYWRKKIERPFNDIVFESGLKHKDSLKHKLLRFFLPITGMLICLFGYVIIAYCFYYMINGLAKYV